MKAVVTFESVYGNTHAIADAVAEGLRDRGEAVVVPAGEAVVEALDGATLLVAGGPTHVHGMTSDRSRKAALDDTKTTERSGVEPHLEGDALRAFLPTLPEGHGRAAAAFDTRIGKPMVVTGSAAKGIAKRLRKAGFELVAAPESFVVTDSPGPLADGELERARAWGRELATKA